MFSMGEYVLAGMVSSGVIIDKFDASTKTVWISLPEKSGIYEKSPTVKTPGDFARQIKTMLSGIEGGEFRVLYKVRKGAVSR